jgi:hypothetical protein
MSSELLFARNHLYHQLCPRALRWNQPLEKNYQKDHEGCFSEMRSGFRLRAYSAWRFGKPARMKGISPTRPQFGSLLNPQVLPLALRRTIHWQCHHHLLQNLLRETAGELRWKRGYLQCDHCAIRVIDGARNLVSGICWSAISQSTCNTRPWPTARIHRDHPFLQLITGCFPPEQLELFQHGIYVHPVAQRLWVSWASSPCSRCLRFEAQKISHVSTEIFLNKILRRWQETSLKRG